MQTQDTKIVYSVTFASVGCLSDTEPMLFETLDEAEAYITDEEYELATADILYSWDICPVAIPADEWAEYITDGVYPINLELA